MLKEWTARLAVLFLLFLALFHFSSAACVEVKLVKGENFFDFETGSLLENTGANLSFGDLKEVNFAGARLATAGQGEGDCPKVGITNCLGCFADMGKTSLESITSTDKAEWKCIPKAVKGHTYIVKTAQNHYAKIYITAKDKKNKWFKFNYYYSETDNLVGSCVEEGTQPTPTPTLSPSPSPSQSPLPSPSPTVSPSPSPSLSPSPSPSITPSPTPSSSPFIPDNDSDGYNQEMDCDDSNASIHPYADEVCDTVDNDCDGLVDEGCDTSKDLDGDGFTVDQGDCDDSDPGINPLVKESCDGVDNDCDGKVDEGCAADADNDGYAAGPDCDDSNPMVHPGASELCDGADNDCDGRVDEGCAADADNDGYETGVDCDDSDASVHPFASEKCDGVDNDCDGRVDEGCAVDLDGDGFDSKVDCDDSNPQINPLAKELCDGIDNDCDGITDEGCGVDHDKDGFFAENDCNDFDASVNPSAAEKCDTVDNDCDGLVDEGCHKNADSDKDGVPDAVDFCPETSQGAKVNSFGCMVSSDSRLKEHFFASSKENGLWKKSDSFFYGNGYLYSVVVFEKPSNSDVLKWDFFYTGKGTPQKVLAREVVKRVFDESKKEYFAGINLDPWSPLGNIPLRAFDYNWRVDFCVNGKKQFSQNFRISRSGADKDNDGVPDANDKCPDSKPGAIVSQTGCETLSEPAVLKHALCKRFDKDSHCIGATDTFFEGSQVISWVEVQDAKKGDRLGWFFKSPRGTRFNASAGNGPEVSIDRPGESHWINYLDLGTIPSEEILGEWTVEFYYNGKKLFADHFKVVPLPGQDLSIKLTTAHGIYADGMPAGIAKKFSSSDEKVVAVLSVPGEIVEEKSGKQVKHSVKTKAVKWRWVWPNGYYWPWKNGQSHDSISPSDIRKHGFEKQMLGVWRVEAEATLQLDGSREIKKLYSEEFEIVRSTLVLEHTLCEFLAPGLSCRNAGNNFFTSDKQVISRIHLGSVKKGDEFKWVFKDSHSHEVHVVKKKAFENGSITVFAFMPVASSPAQLEPGKYGVDFYVNNHKKLTDYFVLKKPEFVIAVIPLNWKGPMKNFEEEADKQVWFFVRKAGLEQKFTVRVEKLERMPLVFGGSCENILPAILEHGLKNMPADRYIGLTDSNYCHGLGFTYLGYPSVYAEAGPVETSAHLLGHTFLLCDEYGYGYWKDNNRELSSKWGFGCPNAYPRDCNKCEQGACCIGAKTSNNGRSIMGPIGISTVKEFTSESRAWLERIVSMLSRGWWK